MRKGGREGGREDAHIVSMWDSKVWQVRTCVFMMLSERHGQLLQLLLLPALCHLLQMPALCQQRLEVRGALLLRVRVCLCLLRQAR